MLDTAVLGPARFPSGGSGIAQFPCRHLLFPVSFAEIRPPFVAPLAMFPAWDPGKLRGEGLNRPPSLLPPPIALCLSMTEKWLTAQTPPKPKQPESPGRKGRIHPLSQFGKQPKMNLLALHSSGSLEMDFQALWEGPTIFQDEHFYMTAFSKHHTKPEIAALDVYMITLCLPTSKYKFPWEEGPVVGGLWTHTHREATWGQGEKATCKPRMLFISKFLFSRHLSIRTNRL